MFDIQNYTSFIAAVLIFQLIPGAGTVAILNATARHGVGVGMKAVFGTLTGDFLYMLAAVLGLAALLAAHPNVLAAAQWLGVVYLCWLGLKLLFAGRDEEQREAPGQENTWSYFRQALGVSLTNPKVIMFFMAFFPLFLTTKSGTVTLVSLMLHVTCISLLYQTLLVFTGNAMARYLSRWRYSRLIATRLAGAALIGFGVRLIMGNR